MILFLSPALILGTAACYAALSWLLRMISEHPEACECEECEARRDHNAIR